MGRVVEYLGLGLCLAGGACLAAAALVDFDSTAARVLMGLAAILFVPGALLALAWVRYRLGPPR